MGKYCQFQLVYKLAIHWKTSEIRLYSYLFSDLMSKIRPRGFEFDDLESLSAPEHAFAISLSDHLSNLIESHRLKRARGLLALGRPGYRFRHRTFVSDVIRLDRSHTEQSALHKVDHGMIAEYSRSHQDTRVMWVEETNEVVVPASMLSFPFVVETLPIWMIAATLGPVIAHELTHSFIHYSYNFLKPYIRDETMGNLKEIMSVRYPRNSSMLRGNNMSNGSLRGLSIAEIS